jgi:two-component system nitrogen regulation response regulator GlnG
MMCGAFDYLLKPLEIDRVRQVARLALESRRQACVHINSATDQGVILLGQSRQMTEVFKAIGHVAASDVAVLIRGESGTGKELVARALHRHGTRAQAPFLAVNCAAIPETLLESELFGHEKGSFTGAERQRTGKFEQCSGGTIFLDEVGDMSPPMQAKLLRVLQEQRFERVGGNTTIETDVRIIAATHRDLEAISKTGGFRADLYWRLNGFAIHLPPLRERGHDLLLLLEDVLSRCSEQLGRYVEGIAPDALQRLTDYSWPGNVRELRNVIERACATSHGDRLELEATRAALLRLPEPERAALLMAGSDSPAFVLPPPNAATAARDAAASPKSRRFIWVTDIA